MSILIGLIFGAYVIGAIPFSVVVARLKKVDLRQIGSGNLGATNVYRALGLKWAVLVFGLDLAKGAAPTAIAIRLFEDPIIHMAVGATAVIGHSLSCFVQFKGGKGAATGLGVLLALAPPVFGIIFPIAAILIWVTRYVAPVTILCAIMAPVLLAAFKYPTVYTGCVAAVSVFIIIRHKANIARLLKGKENRL